MEYAAPYAKERLTGRAFFTATGDTSAFDLGNVQMLEIDYGIKRKEHFSARRGILSLDRYDAYSSMGKWQITSDEFTTPILGLMWLGTVGSAFVQTVGTAATFGFTMAAALKGKVLDIGKYGLANASLTAPAGKVEGYAGDYVIDRGGGKLYITQASTITNGAATVTYDCPAITYDTVTALSQLNKVGTIELQAEDDSLAGIAAGAGAIAPVRYLFQFPCILSADKTGQLKPDDYRSTVMIATLTSPMTVKRLTV